MIHVIIMVTAIPSRRVPPQLSVFLMGRLFVEEGIVEVPVTVFIGFA